MKDYLTLCETAKYLNVHGNTFLRWRKEGRFNAPFINIGGRPRYLKADIDAFLLASKVTPGH